MRILLAQPARGERKGIKRVVEKRIQVVRKSYYWDSTDNVAAGGDAKIMKKVRASTRTYAVINALPKVEILARAVRLPCLIIGNSLDACLIRCPQLRRISQWADRSNTSESGYGHAVARESVMDRCESTNLGAVGTAVLLNLRLHVNGLVIINVGHVLEMGCEY